MTDGLYQIRKKLTFEQAEGAESLPSQLKPKELSQQLRGLLWHVVYTSLMADIHNDRIDDFRSIVGNWAEILYHKHVFRDHLPIDEFDNDPTAQTHRLKRIIIEGDYLRVFGFLQFVLRHTHCPQLFPEEIQEALIAGHAAYRVVDGDTIMPITSETELVTLKKAFVDLAETEFDGARSHLRKAGTELTEGHYSDSIRESVHAVESVARRLAPSKSLKDSLNILDESFKIHGGLKSGFNAIYGYTSDEKGIRHPLLDDPNSKVDEADAVFMIGACASFVSYLINKARLSGLLDHTIEETK